MPFHVRYIDGDLLCFTHTGSGRLETEFGPLDYRPGDWIYLPKAGTWRQLPDTETTWLMISATDEFRVPPPGPLGRHFPFDPAQVVIPEPAPVTSARISLPPHLRGQRARGRGHASDGSCTNGAALPRGRG